MFCEIPVFGRCCFCMPLRRGILTFGYLSLLFAAFMVGLYSYGIHQDFRHPVVLYHGVVVTKLDIWLCVLVYCSDIVFSVVLLYGAHRQILVYLRVYYYYTLCTLAATILLEVVVSTRRRFIYLEVLPMYFIGLCLNVYLIFLVRSLVRKLERSGHTYENQLHQIVYGEVVKDPNSVFPSTVVPVETA